MIHWAFLIISLGSLYRFGENYGDLILGNWALALGIIIIFLLSIEVENESKS